MVLPRAACSISEALLRYLSSTKHLIKMSSIPPSNKLIGTHNGTFHCDEALACYILKLLPEYHRADIVRSRDVEVLGRCDTVVDVGGVYDPSINRYDHHQRTFSDTMYSLTDGSKPWTTKLSSAGLVYLHFGKRAIAVITGGNPTSNETEELFDSVYTNFVEEVDAVDNGIESRDGLPRYNVTSTIGHRIGRLNPDWNDENQDTDDRFQSAIALVGSEFSECVLRHKNSWLPARCIVSDSIEKRLEIDPSGEIIVLEKYCPWKEHLFALEKKAGIESSIKYVLYKEKDATKWRVQAVPIHPNSFESRLPLHELWQGLRDEELSKASGISGCVFVHSNGFIGGNQTYDGVLQMARKTLQESRKK